MLAALGFFAVAAVADLDAAQKAYVDVDYARCRDRAQAALLQPGTVKDRVNAQRLVGLCSAAQGEVDDAREAFRLMLALDPTAKLPDGLSPRFTSSYREAKGSWVGVTPLALVVDSEELGDNGRVVRVRVEDAADLVHKIAWRGPAGALSTPMKKAAVLELEVPQTVDVDVVALDKALGEVFVLTLPARKATGESKLDAALPPPAAVAEDDGGGALPFIIGGAIVGAVVVVGAAAGVAALVFAPTPTVSLKTDVAFN
jgi:hypothetical protein